MQIEIYRKVIKDNKLWLSSIATTISLVCTAKPVNEIIGLRKVEIQTRIEFYEHIAGLYKLITLKDLVAHLGLCAYLTMDTNATFYTRIEFMLEISFLKNPSYSKSTNY